MNWCSVNVQSACNNPYCILQSKAIASHLQEACQNSLFCIVSESGSLNMYSRLSNFPKCCYVFCVMVRLCLNLPQPWAWEHWKRKGKRIMWKKNRSKMFPIGKCKYWYTGCLISKLGAHSQLLHIGSPMSGKAGSDLVGCNGLIKPFWRGGEGRRKEGRKKRL